MGVWQGICKGALLKQFSRLLAAALSVVLIAGCATHPKISNSKVAGKKTLTIVQTPELKNLAVIGAGVAPYFDYHFSSRSDFAFDTAIDPPSPQNSVGAGLVVGVIESSAASTQEKAKAFDSLVRQQLPELNLQDSFVRGLMKNLEARQRSVRLASERSTVLMWPASDETGTLYRTGSLAGAPPVETDLLVQISPIAIWTAINALHPYKMNVSVGIAVFNGRTKEFLGRQTIVLGSPKKDLAYGTYNQLVQDLRTAEPALKAELLSLVPKVADVIVGAQAN